MTNLLKKFMHVLISAIAFYFAAKIGLLMGVGPESISIVWPPSGVALLAVLSWGYTAAIGVLISSFFIEYYSWILPAFPQIHPIYQAIPLAAAIAILATSEAIFSRFFIRRLLPNMDFFSIHHITVFITVVATSSLLNAALSVALTNFFDAVSNENFFYAWLTFGVGNICGALLLVPIGLGLIRNKGSLSKVLSYPFPIIGLGLSLTFMATYMSAQLQQQSFKQNFIHNSVLASSDLRRNLELCIRDIAALQYFYYKVDISQTEFNNAAGPLLQRNQILTSIGWIPYVPASKRLDFEEEISKNELTKLTLFYLSPEKKRIPVPPKKEYFPYRYNIPYIDRMGFDNGSEPKRYQALHEAMNTGEIGISEPTLLLQNILYNPNNQPGILIYYPVYQGPSAADLNLKRPDNIHGFISASFLVEKLVRQSLENIATPNLNIWIFDVSHPEHTGFVYSNTSTEPAPALATLKSGLYAESTFLVANKKWQMIIRPPVVKHLLPPPLLPIAVLGIGISFTLMIAAHFISRRKNEKILLDHDKRLTLQNNSLAKLTQKNALLGEVNTSYSDITEIVAHTLDVDRVSIWLFIDNSSALISQDLYIRAQHQHEHGQVLKAQEFPVYFASVNSAGVIDAVNAQTDIRTREFTDSYLKPNHIGAMLDVPIFNSEGLIGVMCLEHVGEERHWTTDEKTFAEALRNLITLSIESHARKIAQKQLEEANKDLEHKVSLRTHDLETINHQLNEEIIERRYTEQQLKIFRLFADAATQGLGIATIDRSMVYVNPKLQHLLQRNAEPQTSIPDFLDYFSPASRDKLISTGLAIVLKEGHWEDELELILKDGSYFPVYGSVFALLDDQNQPNHIAGILTDISAQKETERALLQAKASAEAADRAKSMFIASMSHELRTPLNSIIGFTSVILQGISGPINDRQKDQLSRVLGSGKHLLSLITDVIDISKIEAGYTDMHIEHFKLRSLIDEALAAVHNQREEKGITLLLDIDDNISLHTDRKRTLQCILNLTSNAVKYSEKGVISITTGIHGDQVTIKVSDTGIGIAPEAQAKLFMPFERIDTHLRVKTPGTGLGLYLTRKIARDFLHGEVSMTSIEGKGSTFTLTIPVNNPHQASATLKGIQ